MIEFGMLFSRVDSVSPSVSSRCVRLVEIITVSHELLTTPLSCCRLGAELPTKSMIWTGAQMKD
ncbi:hypothetical protein [Actinomyces wuliandei]|uniref:hypothetical protein n=1 Tax=Actinomyces wuliandei TaxID=2057743 RepID=UPI000FD90BDE|nr:hypothetical protein [Actinomyces wuliandei]